MPGASVLLVEDERALAMAVVEALTEAGLRVEHAGDGEEALARVASEYLRRGDLRSEDAARGRHDALSRDRGSDAHVGPPRDLRDR